VKTNKELSAVATHSIFALCLCYSGHGLCGSNKMLYNRCAKAKISTPTTPTFLTNFPETEKSSNISEIWPCMRNSVDMARRVCKNSKIWLTFGSFFFSTATTHVIDGVWKVLHLQCNTRMLSVTGTKFPGNSIEVVPSVQLHAGLVREHSQQSAGCAVKQTSSWHSAVTCTCRNRK